MKDCRYGANCRNRSTCTFAHPRPAKKPGSPKRNKKNNEPRPMHVDSGGKGNGAGGNGKRRSQRMDVRDSPQKANVAGASASARARSASDVRRDCVGGYITSVRLNHETLRFITRLFNQLDMDQNGVLSVEDFAFFNVS
eukprot:UC1_evm3s1107